MAIVMEFEVRNDREAAEAIERVRRGAAASREEMKGLGEQTRRNTETAREMQHALLAAERDALLRRRAMTTETFEHWMGAAADAADWTRTTMTASVRAVGRGIADELVDGTHDWRKALSGVLKQMIAVTAQMVVMRSLMTVFTGGAAGWFNVFHDGGPVMHGGGLVRAHTGLRLGFDETPIVAQRGEFILRRRAAESIGPERLDRMNRSGAAGGDSYVFNVSVTAGAVESAGDLARRLGPELADYLRREKRRGRAI